MIPQHSAETVEHYTPSRYIHAAWHVMGGIDLDPATTSQVNKDLVGATNYYTQEDDGLRRTWHGRVWLNPPGGLHEGRSSAAVWWEKLSVEYLAGQVTEALFLGFTLEILRSTQDCPLWPGDMPFCIPSSRIDFLRHIDGKYKKGGSPAHANIVVYLPPLSMGAKYSDNMRRFCDTFSAFGRVRC